MVKIIKEGTRKITTCENCGCKFSYEAEDVKSESTPHKVDADYSFDVIFRNEKFYVICPQCSNKVILSQTR